MPIVNEFESHMNESELIMNESEFINTCDIN